MNSVFELTKASIENCEYNLGEKLRELTLFKIVGQISSDEYSELVQLAYEHADPATTQTNVLMALKAINEEIAKVNAR